jgi:tetratricopeptide (TPR) repeat protein
MENHHLTPEMLRELLNEDRGETETRLLLHVLAVCPECHIAGEDVLDFYRAGALGLDFCALDVDLARSRAEAPALLKKLNRFPFEQQKGLIQDAVQFRSWGLAELLCAESEGAAPTDVTRAIELAELGVILAGLLPEGEPAELSWLCQLRARTFACLGNARRVLGELRRANDAFREADRLWVIGAGDAGDSLGYESRYLALKASLRREERRLPEALALLDQAFQSEPSAREKGAILVNQASVLEELGQIDQAIALLEENSAFVEDAGDRRLFLCLRHNLLLFLTEAGRYGEAGAMVQEVALLSRDLGNGLDLVRLYWAEARIARATGRTEEAIRLLAHARSEFAAQGMGYDTALVSLELALLHAEAGRTEEVEAIAHDIISIFEAQDVHREALAAVTVFVRAADAKTADAALVRKIAEYLHSARHNPNLPFRK